MIYRDAYLEISPSRGRLKLLFLFFVNVRRLCSNQTADWFLQISIGAEVVVSKTVKEKRKEKNRAKNVLQKIPSRLTNNSGLRIVYRKKCGF